jgi:hypothetical protein
MEKRVIAHFMHEEEREAALEIMPGAETTDSYVVGSIDEGLLEELRQRGLIVQLLEDEEDAAAGRPAARGMLRDIARRHTHDPTIAAFPAGPAIYLIYLAGPLIPNWRSQLEALDVVLLEHIPRDAYTAKLVPAQVPRVSELDFVEGIRLFDADDTAPEPEPSRRSRGGGPTAPAGSDATQMLTYDIRLHPGEDLEEVLTWLRDHNVNVAGSGRGKIRLYVLTDSPLLSQIQNLPAVARMELFRPPKLLNDVARRLIGIDEQATSSTTILPQTGAGQIVAVADTGLDHEHPDFQGRIVGRVGLGRPGDSSDPHGHGTHVAGSVLGDGTASNGRVRGTAPGAELFFQSLLDPGGELGGLPLNLNDLFEEAYVAGARIHNNSWGAETESQYTLSSIEVDEFVAEHRDMLVVIAAGNEGRAANNRNAPTGFVDWLSIDSPASAKNALTVGASRSDRAGVGYADLTYQEAFGSIDYPDSPISDERVSGDTEKMAAFSSRGPCDDRRIKPDLVAPGTDILSAKSSLAPLRNFWGPSDARYAYMGGTSMATPLVSGCAALVRQFYVEDRQHDPSAALLKATLINSTRWLTGEDSTADHPKLPNYHQGFGCVHLPWALPGEAEPELHLEFLDTWEDGPHLGQTGQRVRYQFLVEAGYPLRICLTWTDLPARALQNNLNLFLQHVESGQKWMGNEGLPLSLNIPDPENNVEIIRLDAPQPGAYLLQISATNLLQGGQDFALVVTGKLDGQLNLI